MNYFLFLKSDLFLQSYIGISLLSFNFAIIGTTLIEKKLSLLGDTFSHAILPGVVISHLLLGSGLISLILGGWISGIILILLTLFLSGFAQINKDSSFAFLSVFFVAIGMVVAFKFQTSSEVLHLLFGNVFVFDQTLNLLVLCLTLVTFFLFYCARHIWSLWILDPTYQILQSFWLKFLAGLSLLLFVTHLTLGLYSLGSLMMVGLLLIPSLAAQQLATKLYSRIWVACLISLVGHFMGLTLSFILDVPIGPSLILSSSVLFLIVVLLRHYKTERHVNLK